LVITDENEALSRLLLEGQHVLLRYPQAARALMQAFVNEGRQFASTPEGQAWQRPAGRLRPSPPQPLHLGRLQPGRPAG
jgi:hypothetical protein